VNTATPYLFVYGTLRSNFDIYAKQHISGCMELVGTAEVRGRMYDMGDYPAAVPVTGEEESTIRGEVFLLRDPDKVFAALDSYEGDAYGRSEVDVMLPDGRQEKAWIYWYRNSVEGKELIQYKDYVEYLKNKNSVY